MKGHAGGIMTVGHRNVGLDQGQMRQDQTTIEAQMAKSTCANQDCQSEVGPEPGERKSW